MGPSWADLPLTVKVTPLGALDLTSRFALGWLVSVLCARGIVEQKQTRVGVVEVLVQELWEPRVSYRFPRGKIGDKSYVIGRLGDVRESSRSRHGE